MMMLKEAGNFKHHPKEGKNKDLTGVHPRQQEFLKPMV
jgi:hypothetical protein